MPRNHMDAGPSWRDAVAEAQSARDDVIEAQGVAALQASLKSLMAELEIREEECTRLKDDNRRARDECTRLRSKLNDEYASSAANMLTKDTLATVQTAGLLEVRAQEDARRLQFMIETWERRAELERSMLSHELRALEEHALADRRAVLAELGRAEARVAQLEEPVQKSLLGWLDVPSAAPVANTKEHEAACKQRG